MGWTVHHRTVVDGALQAADAALLTELAGRWNERLTEGSESIWWEALDSDRAARTFGRYERDGTFVPFTPDPDATYLWGFTRVAFSRDPEADFCTVIAVKALPLMGAWMTSESPEEVRHHAKVLAYHDTGSADFEATCLRFAEHFRQWVPDRGEAETDRGQVLRAVSRLAGEWRRNGNMNWDPMFEDLVDALRDALLDEPALAHRHAGIRRDLDGVCADGRGDGTPQEALRVAFGRLIEDAVSFVEVTLGR